jgi:hypothetical protein
MDRFYNRGDSLADRQKELKSFSGEHAVRNIIIDLHNKNITRERAEKLLVATDATGLIKCGELCIQDAYDLGDTEESLNKLIRAAELFQKAIKQKHIFNSCSESVYSRAKMHFSHLQIHGSIIQEVFPDEKTSQKAHNSTIDISGALLDQANEWDQGRREIVGALGEFATLGLLERLALQIGTEIYFPLESTYDQDHSNSHGSTMSGAWDISIFSDVCNGNGMNREKCIQVKANSVPTNSIRNRIDREGISLLSIDPDLRLGNNDVNFIPGGIINDLVTERDCDPNLQASRDATKRLDDRTEKLLVTLERY